MIGKTHFAGVLTTLFSVGEGLLSLPLENTEIVCLRNFNFIEFGFLLNNQPFLSRDVLLILFGITLLALTLSLAYIFFYLKNNNRQTNPIKFFFNNEGETLTSQNEFFQQYIGIISHDLRSPLNSITAFSELLTMDAEHLPTEEIKNYSRNIHHLAMRVNHLVNNMMDASNIELGEVKLELNPVSVEQILYDIFKSLKILGNKKSINTLLSIEEDLPKVMADPEALRRVLENLINNAFKFSKEGSSVKIDAKLLQQENKVKISIRDEGPGFTEADRKNLYNKFSKLSAKPTGKEKTTGLGLFIVHKLVKRMNGNIELDSTPGKGSVFSVILDIAS